MHPYSCRNLSVALLAAVLCAPLPAAAADSEPLDLDPNQQALVARERIKQRGATRRSDAQFGQAGGRGGEAGCGQVDIGNVESSGRGRSAVLNQRQTTVVVTGPVINAARCR